MQKVISRTSLRGGRFSRTSGKARYVILYLFVAALTFCALCWPIISGEYKVWRAQSAFEEKTSEAKYLGKTADQVIGVLGPPTDQVTFSDGSRDLIYDGPYDADCRVEIRGGVVTRVEHWTK
jgi:hypothetical protein